MPEGNGTKKRNDEIISRLMSRCFIQPSRGIRGWMDGTGYAALEIPMRAVLHRCNAAAAPRWKWLLQRYGWRDDIRFAAGICPHDDYYYAGRFYPLVLPYVACETVIVFGVSHVAARLNIRDVLIFDGFEKWYTPFGPMDVSKLRKRIVEAMPSDACSVRDDLHQIEHSIEAILPFLNAYHPGTQIIPILVPPMGWERMVTLSKILADVLDGVLAETGRHFPKDVSILCSNDAVHYGDHFGEGGYAPFGTDAAGYIAAVAQDRRIIETYLCGPPTPERLKGFLECFCDPDGNPVDYRITWCGRFSVTLGLLTASKLARISSGNVLNGHLLDYGTSISEMSLDVGDIEGVGPTAPNNFHHFVGYVAMGYSGFNADRQEA